MFVKVCGSLQRTPSVEKLTAGKLAPPIKDELNQETTNPEGPEQIEGLKRAVVVIADIVLSIQLTPSIEGLCMIASMVSTQIDRYSLLDLATAVVELSGVEWGISCGAPTFIVVLAKPTKGIKIEARVRVR